MPTIPELTWRSMTTAINEVDPAASFLVNLLYGREEPKATESLEVGIWEGPRQMAPFVKKNGEAVMVKGRDHRFREFLAPNIRIKIPFKPSPLLYGRTPGTPVFVERGTVQSAIAAHIAGDIEYMASYIENAKEYLAAQSLTGTISFTDDENDAFEINYYLPAGHNVDLSAAPWTNPATPIELQVLDIKRKVNNATGLNVTHCIMGDTAAAGFITNTNIKERLDNRRIEAGDLQLQMQFENSGAVYLGRIYGISWWLYSRSIQDHNGATVPLIGTNKAHFVSVSPDAQFTMYYGAIPDMKAIQGGLFQGRIFSKTWEEDDPSAMFALAHSRPLPVPRRPGAMAVATIA